LAFLFAFCYCNRVSLKRNGIHVISLNEIREQLHRCPELSFKEYETTKYIEQVLQSWGLELHRYKKIETGGYCDIGQGKIIGFRADIDALPILENMDHSIKSLHPGIMHACGHDYHTTIALGLAKYFLTNPERLNDKKLRIFFQPGEEAAPGGAEKVIEEKSWSGVELILGVHVTPNEKSGTFFLFDGPVQASSTSLKIILNGPGGHTSKPEETIDLIRVTGNYINQLQQYLQNETAANEKLVFAFGSVTGGSTHNIIPQTVQLRGSFRTLSNNVLTRTNQKMKAFSISFDKIQRTKTVVQFPTNCPATINNSALSKQFASFMEHSGRAEDLVQPETPSMGADDFSFYAQQVPGLYLIVGGGGKGTLHSGDLELSDALIEPAINCLADFITDLNPNILNN